ncbi:hypothetical protein Tco_1135064 [Tanacetum coccineum]
MLQQPDRFVPDHQKEVYHSKESSIGIKQAQELYDELSKFLISKGFTKNYEWKTVDQTDYRSKIESLMYLTSSRPDIVQAGFGFNLTKLFQDARSYCRYCVDTRKSISGGIQFLEAEYVALSASCAQVMWMRTQLQDYGFNYNKILLYCDSQSAIAISCNPVQHSRTKHIHTRYHFIKEQVENGIIELYFVRIEYQLADMFTKALSKDRFQYLVRRIGMRCLTPAELEGRMPTKIELTLEQSQQGVSNDVLNDLSDTYVTHNEDGKSCLTTSNKALDVPVMRTSKHEVNLIQFEYKILRFELETLLRDSVESTDHSPIPAEVGSLPTCSMLKLKDIHKQRDSRIMKAQELKTKTSAQTLIYKIFLQRYQVYQGRLLARFQDDAKYEHVGQDTRSQGGKDDQDGRIKI